GRGQYFQSACGHQPEHQLGDDQRGLTVRGRCCKVRSTKGTQAMLLQTHAKRKGSILPLVAVCLVSLVGCVALAVDIGLFAEARTEMQDAVDAAVLAGCWQFDTIHPQNNAFVPVTGAVDTAKRVVKLNTVIGDSIKDADITDLQVGVYRYVSTATPPGFQTLW